MKPELYDVVAVGIESGEVEELVATKLAFGNAEAVESMAALRRGNDEHFFAVVDAGRYQVGDVWEVRP